MSKKSLNKTIFDTSVYIDFFNNARFKEYLYDPDYLVYVSSVVLMELFVGTYSKKETQSLNNLFRLYKMKNRIIIPTSEIYIEAGKVASLMINELSYDLKKSFGLINDILIALSARQIGATVFTHNRKDFGAINRFKKISFSIL